MELAGKFGFILLLFGFFSIFYGFERYISLQREIINESAHSVSLKLASTFRFYIFNFLISSPLLAILLFNYVISNIILILCCLLVSFTEHISNAVYNISIVYSTYLVAMPAIIIKNVFMFILVVLLIFFKQENTIEIIIYCWSILSFLQLIVFSKWFANSLSVSKIQFWKYSLGEIKNHYSVAKINFLIGLISVLSLQCDRLIVGYSLDELMIHLESLFEEGMTWENYGDWHIDHRIPKSWFNFETINDPEFIKCWDLNNLKPMWASENIAKGNKFSD